MEVWSVTFTSHTLIKSSANGDCAHFHSARSSTNTPPFSGRPHQLEHLMPPQDRLFLASKGEENSELHLFLGQGLVVLRHRSSRICLSGRLTIILIIKYSRCVVVREQEYVVTRNSDCASSQCTAPPTSAAPLLLLLLLLLHCCRAPPPPQLQSSSSSSAAAPHLLLCCCGLLLGCGATPPAPPWPVTHD